ncbi:MAG: WG repeat-containing protein [Clostridia bacterium]|nr:WG repeat-containing protein [Clostridia bacterium]
MIRNVKEACEGNVAAMGRLFSKTLKSSYYLAEKLSGDEMSASDITKKAYARAFCTVTKLKKPEAFDIWMKQNVINVFKESNKFTFSQADSGAEEGGTEFLSEDVIADSEKSAAVLSCVDGLGKEEKTATVLHYFCGMPVSSLAKYFNVSDSTINTVLGKARSEIFSASGSSEPVNAAVGTLPVLTRLMRNEMELYAIDGSKVREIFTYAVDIFNSFRQVELSKAKENGGDEESANGYFTQKLAGQPSVPTSNYASSGLSIPKAPDKPESDGIDYSAFEDNTSAGTSYSQSGGSFISNLIAGIKGIDFKKFNWKKILVCAAAILVLLLIIIGIGKACSKDDNTVTDETGNISSNVENNLSYKWLPGGFESLSEIEYLDDHAIQFKSTATGKYGLMDYQGKVIISPEYDRFERCGYHRDYDGDNNYHTIVSIDGGYYNVVYSADGSASISPQFHDQHGIDQVYLDKGKAYDERDRYYEGYAAARKNDKWGYVSQANDKKVIPYEYEAVNTLTEVEASRCDYCRPVNGGLIPVKQNGLMGIINLENEIVVPFEYMNIMPGLNGVYVAQKDGQWGVITVGSAIDTFTGVNFEIANQEDVSEFESGETMTYIIVADTGINVRSGPGSEYEDIGDLAADEEVEGLGTTTASSGKEWLKIKWEDGYGYIAMSYVVRK